MFLFQLENERLKKTVDVLERTVQFKNEEIESKNCLINKFFEKGLQQISTDSSFSVPTLQDDLNITKDVVEDLDIDSLLKANLGEVNFDEILDMNIEKLSARYPEGTFDAYYSENRQEGDL